MVQWETGSVENELGLRTEENSNKRENRKVAPNDVHAHTHTITKPQIIQGYVGDQS